MTNQQVAPEALPDPSPDQLRAIARTARNSSGSASDDCGPLAYVLYGWRAAAIALRTQQAALVEAQQPAAHVQNPAEVEHVAGDVSKNRPESNMAQQPAPSAAGAVGEVPLPLLVRDIAADLGTTPIQVCTALAQLGFGGHSVNMAVTPRMAQSLRAHFASPTPQADSQPAPVRDYPPLPTAVGVACFFKGELLSANSLRFQKENNDDGAFNEYNVEVFTVDEMRADVDADRAARAPADSVTAPAGGEINRLRAQVDSLTRDCGRQASKIAELGADLKFQEEKHREDRARLQALYEHQRGECWYWQGDGQDHLESLCNTLPVVIRADQLRALVSTPPAQAADSVLEDAARWQETLMHVGAANHLGGQHFTLNTLRIRDQMFLLRGSVAQHFTACIDDSRAARKQGANHD